MIALKNERMRTLTIAVIATFLLMGMLLIPTVTGLGTNADDDDDDDDALFGLAMTGFCCFLPIIMWIIFLAIAIWVYKDAEARGKSGALWLIIVLITGIIGIIIWLIVRPKEFASQPGAYQPPYQPPMQPPYQPPPQYPPEQPPQYPPEQPPQP